MKQIAYWLRRLADWLDAPSVASTPLAHMAEILVRQAEDTHSHASGEHRRHQVYARLLKEFPLESKRTLSQAIETAVQALP